MLNVIRQFVKEEEGASAAEYALLVALITVTMAGLCCSLATTLPRRSIALPVLSAKHPLRNLGWLGLQPSQLMV